MKLGLPVTLSKAEEGLFTLEGRKISISGGEKSVDFSIFEMFVTCANEEPCPVESFVIS